LIVDRDLSFAFWLGRVLDNAGYVSLPAQNTASATDLIVVKRISLDLLVIDSSLPDGEPFLMRMRRSQPRLKGIAALPENSKEEGYPSFFDASKRKPRHRSAEAALEWVSLVAAMFPPCWQAR